MPLWGQKPQLAAFVFSVVKPENSKGASVPCSLDGSLTFSAIFAGFSCFLRSQDLLTTTYARATQRPQRKRKGVRLGSWFFSCCFPARTRRWRRALSPCLFLRASTVLCRRRRRTRLRLLT